MTTPANPRAFPLPHIEQNGSFLYQDGMTLRDWFAGQALAAMPRLGDTDADMRGIAHDAYLLADSMLAERERGV